MSLESFGFQVQRLEADRVEVVCQTCFITFRCPESSLSRPSYVQGLVDHTEKHRKSRVVKKMLRKP